MSRALAVQVKELVQSSRDAEEQLAALEEARADASVDQFLHNASFIVERLESLSIDISRAYGVEMIDEMWQKFHRGDHSVFLRSLVKMFNKNEYVRIKEHYERDAQFRDFVTRYLAEFEALLNSSGETDRADVLAAAFTSADRGQALSGAGQGARSSGLRGKGRRKAAWPGTIPTTAAATAAR